MKKSTVVYNMFGEKVEEGVQAEAWSFFSAMANASIDPTDNGYIGKDIYGNIYYYRPTSKDGTAVVDINGKNGNAKTQKIHFINE